MSVSSALSCGSRVLFHPSSDSIAVGHLDVGTVAHAVCGVHWIGALMGNWLDPFSLGQIALHRRQRGKEHRPVLCASLQLTVFIREQLTRLVQIAPLDHHPLQPGLHQCGPVLVGLALQLQQRQQLGEVNRSTGSSDEASTEFRAWLPKTSSTFFSWLRCARASWLKKLLADRTGCRLAGWAVTVGCSSLLSTSFQATVDDLSQLGLVERAAQRRLVFCVESLLSPPAANLSAQLGRPISGSSPGTAVCTLNT